MPVVFNSNISMTSSAHDLSENSEPVEQEKEGQLEIQHQSTAIANLQPGVVAPLSGYMIPNIHFEAGQAQTAYPYIDPYYGGLYAAFGGQPVIHPHVIGMHHPGVPLQTDTVEEPVYVNAKQYHGILRRRQSRAKAESENKLLKGRKPYLHESRHLHALKRARGSGGRFLNSKFEENQESGSEGKNNGVASNGKSQPPNDPASENFSVKTTSELCHDKTESNKAPGSN